MRRRRPAKRNTISMQGAQTRPEHTASPSEQTNKNDQIRSCIGCQGRNTKHTKRQQNTRISPAVEILRRSAVDRLCAKLFP
jgi:hypothetical protein